LNLACIPHKLCGIAAQVLLNIDWLNWEEFSARSSSIIFEISLSCPIPSTFQSPAAMLEHCKGSNPFSCQRFHHLAGDRIKYRLQSFLGV